MPRKRESRVTSSLGIGSVVSKGFGMVTGNVATNNGHHQADTQQVETKQGKAIEVDSPQPEAPQQAEPEPVKTQPVDTLSVEPEPVKSQSVDILSVEPEPVKTQPVGTSLVDTQLVDILQAASVPKTLATAVSIPPSNSDTEDIDTFLRKKKRLGQFTTLHLIDGEKGGVGKSLFCKVLLQYAQQRGFYENIKFVESDVTNPDVGRVYFPNGDYRTAEFSLEERKRQNADLVFELAMKNSVIVNLPSNISMSVNDWMERNQVISLGKEFYQTKVCKWFVCTGNHSSLEKFKESLAQFEQNITHVLVKNQMIHDDWPIDDDMAALMKKNGVLEMKFPRFDMAERNKVDALQLTFGKAVTDSRFTALGKQRIKNFLEGCYEGLDKLELLP